jgi:hypothetical protein
MLCKMEINIQTKRLVDCEDGGCITWRISKLQTYELMRQHYMISTRQDGQDLLQMQLWMQRMLIKPSSWGYYCSGNDSVLNLFDYTHSHVPHDNNRTHYS